MPPKDTVKKVPASVVRPPISESSLLYTPEDVIEGFHERELMGIDWTLVEQGALHHKQCTRNKEDIPEVTFSQALNTKIENSIFGSFWNENCKLTLDQLYEILLPITIWDNEMFANKEGKICFNNSNNVTDDLLKIVKQAVKVGDVNLIKKSFKMANVLRVNDLQMTTLDVGLSKFRKLVTLNLCGNFMEHLEASLIPRSVRMLELQANRIKTLAGFAAELPDDLLYLGLARNLLTDESIESLKLLPRSINVLDISHNDICDLESLLRALSRLPNLAALIAVGNPCAVCAAYACVTLKRLPRLRWLDAREILPTDRSSEAFEPHPDDLRSAYFHFTVLRVMSAPQPPKPDKGSSISFHIELEIPLLDPIRRSFLMYRHNESLTEMLPSPEDDELLDVTTQPTTSMNSKTMVVEEASSHESDVYKVLTTKNSREIHHYTTYESNHVQWNKIMNFQEPTIKIFVPNLEALRDTFRSAITVRLVYTLISSAKSGKPEKKSNTVVKNPPLEQRVVLATIRCSLQQPDWSQPSQHFHWDASLGTNDAIHWGDGDLAVLQYNQGVAKVAPKVKSGESDGVRQLPPDNLTCHFAFGIDTLRA